MTRPVNLRTVRKQKARAADRAAAKSNATRFGRSKAQKSRDEAGASLARRRLDAHRRDDPPDA